MLRYKDTSGTLRTIRQLSVKDNGGTVRVLQKLSTKVGGTLKLVYSSLEAAASPTPVTGSVSNLSPSDITTNTTTATPTGGVGPFTYAWSLTDGEGSWSIDSPTAATTAFTASFVIPGELVSANFECLVTDSVGSTATTNTVYATASNDG